MIIRKIKLNNFRNYEKEEILLEENTNILFGKNGQGKTNILEAILVCSIGKSFRNAKDFNMLMNTKEYFKIEIEFYAGEREQEITYIFKQNKREIFINGIKIKRMGELIGNIPSVIFSPEDLKIIKGGPLERRRFLDIIICQLNNKYFYDLQKYNKIVLNRNILLKNKNNRKIDSIEMEAWDEGLIEIGSIIIKKRKEYLKIINEKANEFQKYLSNKNEKLNIEYKINNSENNDFADDEIENYMRKQIRENKKREQKYGSTLVGPHRDEISILINKYDIKKYGSQGQQRTAILAIKLAELEILKENLEESPILLLDDVMSELDSERKVRLNKLIKGIQVVITTTEANKEVNDLKKYIKISQGIVI